MEDEKGMMLAQTEIGASGFATAVVIIIKDKIINANPRMVFLPIRSNNIDLNLVYGGMANHIWFWNTWQVISTNENTFSYKNAFYLIK